jgi:basic membrane lipoprotein Med (substrate-binding protein (PBP1-ABC) superfamily)
MSRLVTRLCFAGVVSLSLHSCQSPQRGGADSFRVALITPGSIADAAWNSGAYAGLLRIRDSLGASISHVEALTPAAQEAALRAYAAQGFDVIFANGFEFQEPAERVAASFPEPVFVVNSGSRAAGKVVPLVFRIEEATYLAGMVAGGLSRSGVIGFVGGVELPPVRRGQEGWVNGARAVNAAIESRVTYLNNWEDAASGREAALALLRLGVDMLHHNADAAALGAFQAVKESRSGYIFGANADQSSLAPDRVVGSAVIDLAHAFLLVAGEARRGELRFEAKSFGLSGDVLRYVPNPKLAAMVPAGLLARVNAAADSIVAGTLNPLGQEEAPIP